MIQHSPLKEQTKDISLTPPPPEETILAALPLDEIQDKVLDKSFNGVSEAKTY